MKARDKMKLKNILYSTLAVAGLGTTAFFLLKDKLHDKETDVVLSDGKSEEQTLSYEMVANGERPSYNIEHFKN